MTQRMLTALRTGETRVDMSLYETDEDDLDAARTLVECRGGRWLPKADSFVHLRVKVTNQSRTSHHLLQLRRSELIVSIATTLVATLDIALEPAQHIVFEGVSSNIPLTKLAEGESYEVEVPITFVSLGHFDLSAQVRRLGNAVGIAGRGQLSAIVQERIP